MNMTEMDESTPQGNEPKREAKYHESWRCPYCGQAREIITNTDTGRSYYICPIGCEDADATAKEQQ